MSKNNVRRSDMTLLLCVFMMTYGGTLGAVSERFYFPPPGESLESQDQRAAQDVGLESEVVSQLNSQIPSGRWALWRHGYLIHVEGDFNQTTEVKSLRKTWHALTVGAALQQGRIPSLDQKISSWCEGLTGKHAKATWRHVITQTSGFDYPYDSFPAYAPGAIWTYSDKNPRCLCNALARVYGKQDCRDNYDDVVHTAYFDAIGMRGWKTSVREDGIRFHFDLEDMGRLGLLVVARGTWRDKEIVPRSFVESLERKQTHGAKVNYNGPDDGRVGLDPKDFPEAPYGFMTWVNTDGDYYPGADSRWAWGAGAGGSYILWNRSNGIVFAGFGIDTKPTRHGIPHIIESSIRGDNPLSQGERPATSDRASGTNPATREVVSVPRWGLFETEVVNGHTYANPFRDVTLDAAFTSPSGKAVKFFGYHDGDGRGNQSGNVWKIRFMPDETGIWSYACQFSDGRPGKNGGFACTARGAKPGPLRVEGQWLKFADGKRFYLRSYYFSEAFCGKSPCWENTMDTLFGKRRRFNLCCTTFWQGRLLQKNRWNNIEYNGFYPIQDRDYTRLKLVSWRHVDEVVGRLESRGAVWFNFDGFVPNVGGEMGGQRTDFEAQKVYVRNVVARLAPYWNVTWNIAFEWGEFLTADQVRLLVDFTKGIDPWDHIITVHDQGAYKTTEELVTELHVDFVTLQYDAGKCGDTVTANRFIQRYTGRAPVYAQEVCWEANSKLDGEQVRKGAWGVALAGGLLNYAEMFDGPNQGKPQNYGDGKAIPYLEIMFDFMQSLPYQRMNPYNELVNEGCICFAEPGSHYVCYAPKGGAIEVDLSRASGDLGGQWLDPRDGGKTPTATVEGGGKMVFRSPDNNDWVLYLHRIQ